MTNRQAKIKRDIDGEILGVPLFLGKSDLEELELDIAGVDSLRYEVEESEIRFSNSDETNLNQQ